MWFGVRVSVDPFLNPLGAWCGSFPFDGNVLIEFSQDGKFD